MTFISALILSSIVGVVLWIARRYLYTPTDFGALSMSRHISRVRELEERFGYLFKHYGLDTINRRAYFWANVLHESRGYPIEENLNYSATGLLRTFPKYFNAVTAARFARNPEAIANRVYANRMGNGISTTGDGWRYRGRGLMQITGKSMYRLCGNYLGVDLVRNPDLLIEDLELSLKAALWYFCIYKKLNARADLNQGKYIRWAINGGSNGLKEVEQLTTQLKKILT